jgi:hypothetical protein
VQVNWQTDDIAAEAFDPDKILFGVFGEVYLFGTSYLKPAGQVNTF